MIIDSREQKPLWTKGERRKLDEGDYAMKGLEEFLVVERKTPQDLYGSIVQGHKRFIREVQRSFEKNKDFFVFIECSYEDFIKKNWRGGYYRKLKGRTLAAIIATMKLKYNVSFVWCQDRHDCRRKIQSLFSLYTLLYTEKYITHIK